MAQDKNHYVRQSVAESLCPIGRTVRDKEMLAEKLNKIVEILLADSMMIVRISIAGKLGQLANLLPSL